MFGWDVRKSQELCTVPVSAPQLKGVTHHSDHDVLDGWSLSNEFALAFGSPRAVNPVINGVKKGHRSREGPSHRCVLVGCQRGGLTVTSACDLGVVCHVGLFLVHAVTRPRSGPLSTGSRACTRFLHFLSAAQHGRRQLRSRPCFTLRRA